MLPFAFASLSSLRQQFSATRPPQFWPLTVFSPTWPCSWPGPPPPRGWQSASKVASSKKKNSYFHIYPLLSHNLSSFSEETEAKEEADESRIIRILDCNQMEDQRWTKSKGQNVGKIDHEKSIVKSWRSEPGIDKFGFRPAASTIWIPAIISMRPTLHTHSFEQWSQAWAYK